MNKINHTQAFDAWLLELKDIRAKRIIFRRINNAVDGNFGDHHFLRGGVWEMRIHYGPGYRLYYAQEGSMIYLLLVGGDKQTQSRDIEKAVAMWKAYREGTKK